MSTIFGVLGLQDTDNVYINAMGQRVVFDAVAQVLQDHVVDLNKTLSVFVQGETTDYKARYMLPGSGYLQKRGGYAQSGAVKQFGSWDVAFPLEDFGDQLSATDVALAYMDLRKLNMHLDTIKMQDLNTVRREILKALLDNTVYTVVDEQYGSLTVQSLANGDTVVYPPVLGSDTEATEDHFSGQNYLTAAIDATHEPCTAMRNELEEHFGAPTGGSNIVAFFNQAEAAYIEKVTGFVKVPDNFTRVGADTATLIGVPNVPGRIMGRLNGVWCSEWRSMPAAYALAVDLDAPPPLQMRVDPPSTGLGTGLQLVEKDRDYPFVDSHYRHRFGVGVANRLNGVATYFVASTAYTIPTGYDRA